MQLMAFNIAYRQPLKKPDIRSSVYIRHSDIEHDDLQLFLKIFGWYIVSQSEVFKWECQEMVFRSDHVISLAKKWINFLRISVIYVCIFRQWVRLPWQWLNKRVHVKAFREGGRTLLTLDRTSSFWCKAPNCSRLVTSHVWLPLLHITLWNTFCNVSIIIRF